MDNSTWKRQGMSDAGMELQNQASAENLSHKISRLKSLAFDIETETKDHNRLLDDTDNDFDGSKGLLSGSLNRAHKLLNSGYGERRFTCYLAAVIVILFVISYYLIYKIPR